jgi:hypothetical protein
MTAKRSDPMTPKANDSTRLAPFPVPCTACPEHSRGERSRMGRRLPAEHPRLARLARPLVSPYSMPYALCHRVLDS